MRFFNKDKDLKLYAVTGTQTVLLSFDIARSKLDGKQFLGFDIERKDSKGQIRQINGSKHFDSLIHDATITDPKIKFLSLVQSFFWKDYTADPGEVYTYTVKAMSGTPINHVPLSENSIKVRTEKLQDGKHSVYFNYGVTGSQGYANNKEFGNRPIKQLKGQVLKDALSFLGRELWNEGLVKFVQQAKSAKHSLFCAFYEFQYPDFLKEIKAAQNRGAEVQIVYSAKADQNEDKKNADGTIKRPGNESSIKKAGLASVSHPRTKPSQPHNKFMVLCENGKPKQVWTGSTNITTPGIFGQCNTGHWIVDDKIAAQYKQYWDGIVNDPAMGKQSVVSEQIQADTDLVALKDGSYVFFSPRDLPKPKVKTTPPHLANYAKLIDSAKELVCMIFPFNIDDVFKKVYREDKNYLRLLIFEKTAEAKSVSSNDIDLKITAGAVLDSEVEQWTKEETAKYTSGAGILYVHNKFFLVDPLGADPVIITGSANFSAPSITSNDENSILIKGNQRVADIYLTEFNRLFEHFWPRYLRKILPKSKQKDQGFEKPLDETFTWHGGYFDSSKYDFKRKQLFIKMKGAKKG